jgi:hypothetical protein
MMNINRFDRISQVETEDGTVEEQLGFNRPLKVLRAAKTVLFPLEGEVGIRDSLGIQDSRHRMRLGRRDDRIIEPLQQNYRA